jgi:hypothetical protein
MVARLVDPQPMRLEVSGDGQLRRVKALLTPQRSDNLGRQEVRVDDHVPRLLLEKLREAPQVELFDRQAEPIALAPRPPRPVEHVVEIPQHVRHSIDQVQIRLAIQPAKGCVGQVEHVQVLDDGPGIKLPQGKFDRLGSAQMARAHRGGQDENSLWHV